MTDFKIRRGLSTDLFINGDNKAGVIEGVVLENGCWYLCTDTADLFLCVQQTNGLTLKRINEKAGWDITIDGDTIDASVIIALRAEVDNIKESLNDYAKTSDIPSLEGYATKEFVVDAIDKHEALATIEEVKTKLETEVLPTVQETILPTVQKVEIEILPTVQELAEKAATQEWVQAQNFANETFVEEKISEIEMPEVPTKVSELENDTGYITLTEVPETNLSNYYNKAETETLVTDVVSGKADKDHAHDTYADKDHLHEQYLTEHQSLDHKADKVHTHEEYLTEHQDLSHLATKEHAHEEYALVDHEHDEYLTEHQDISGKADVDHKHDDLYEAKGAVAALKNELLNGAGEAFDTLKELGELINDNAETIETLESIATGKADKEHTHTEYAVSKHTHDQYLTEQSLAGYAKQSDLFSRDYKDLTNKPELFSGDYEDLTNKPAIPEAYDDTDIRSLISDKADSDHSHENYAEKDHTHEAYYTKSEVEAKIPSLDGYAKTEDIPTDYLTETDLDDYAKSADLSDMATKTWVSDQGFITNVDNKADVNHTHDDYLTSSALDGYSKFSGSYKDLTDKPEIPSLEGYALKSDVDLKANNVLFTVDKYVTTAFGGFAKGESVKALTIVEILTKLLGLADEAPSEDPDTPSEPDGIIENIISNKLPMYSIGTVGGLDSAVYDEVVTYTKATAKAKPTKSGFYQVVDENGVVIESGYQDFTVDNPNVLYIIALPKDIDFNTMVTTQVYNDLESCWSDAPIEMSNDAEQLSGICAAFGIDLSNIDLEKYTLWADLASGQGPSGKIYRFIINE